jgi:hypothetical protein
VIGDLVRVSGLFVVTAVAEIFGCYLAYLWLRCGRSGWLLLPGAASLALFRKLSEFRPSSKAFPAPRATRVPVVRDARRTNAQPWRVAGDRARSR